MSVGVFDDRTVETLIGLGCPPSIFYELGSAGGIYRYHMRLLMNALDKGIQDTCMRRMSSIVRRR